jgi:uncharacterized protein (DUF2252 family)
MSKKLLEHFQSKTLSIEERMEKGKALRAQFPRLKMGDYKPSRKRADPISILEKQAKTRLPELVPIRHSRMLASPFSFLRGAAAIMAADLANSQTTGIKVQTCGDLHVANFGAFASAERNLVFGINDFDETMPGPWEWDLKRLVASIVAAGKFLGADDKLCEESVRAAITSYRKRIRQYAYMGNMELWYANIKEEEIMKSLSGSAKERVKKLSAKARERTHLQVLSKLTDLVDDKYRLKDNAPFIIHETHSQTGRTIEEATELLLQSYLPSLINDRRYLLEQYRIVDVARKVVGVGSVGTRCWVIFLKGNHDEDPLFLQLKEAQPSVLEPFLEKSKYSNNGQRVVAGQRLIQGTPDIFLGYGELDGIHFYVRQLRDMKGGVEFDPDKIKVENLPQYCSVCAWATALAHAKSGDAAMIAGYVGKSEELDDAMVKFAFTYNTQTNKDYAAFQKAVKTGRIKTSEKSE